MPVGGLTVLVASTSGLVASPNWTEIIPSLRSVTETWPYWLRVSRIWSRRSSRSLGEPPPRTASRIATLRVCSSVAAFITGPLGPVMSPYSVAALSLIACSRPSSVENAAVRALAVPTTACRAALDSGFAASASQLS